MLRHDEQENESFYDDRTEASDDIAKGHLKFPKDRLYGRDEELKQLLDLHKQMMTPSDDASGRRCQVVVIEGFSGVGKSSMVHGFVHRLEQQQKETNSTIPVLFCSGKYYDETMGDSPLSAVADALSMVVRQLIQLQKQNPQSGEDELQSDLREAGFSSNSEAAKVLLEVVPDLAPLLPQVIDSPPPSPMPQPTDAAIKEEGNQSVDTIAFDNLAPQGRVEETSFSSLASMGELHQSVDIKKLTFVFTNFFQTVCTATRPLILFLDDMQWMDPASVGVLGSILTDSSMQHLFFIGSYRTIQTCSLRSNRLPLENLDLLGQLEERSRKSQKGSHPPLQRILLSNVGPQYVQAFVAETLDRDFEEVAPLAEVVYSKSLGNMFFCRQVMEELLRRNAIYYDVMAFQWQFNVDDRLDLDTALNHDVVEMVQSKIDTLPKTLQRALILAAYIGHSTNLATLLECMKADGYEDMKPSELEKYLEQAVSEGLLLRPRCARKRKATYQFAHNRVQEAAYTLVPRGRQQHVLLDRTGHVLVRLEEESGNPKDEWMLFVAVDHFNAIPITRIDNVEKLLRLNLKVGILCLAKASFDKAVRLFRKAIASVDDKLWEKDYEFCLSLHNRCLEAEFALGNYEEAQSMTDVILQRATSPRDKAYAHHTHIGMTIKMNNNDYTLGTEEGVKLLSEYDQPIPLKPTKADIAMERLRLTGSLAGRPHSIIAGLPYMEEDWLMKLLSQLIYNANMAANDSLRRMASLRALRLTLQRGISKYLPSVLTDYGPSLRQEGKFPITYSYALVLQKVQQRFPNDRGHEYVTSRMILHSGMLHLKNRFVNSVDDCLSTYRMALAIGSVDVSLACAMHVPFIYFACGLPMTHLLESKLALFEDKAKQLNRLGFQVVFRLCRQFMYNLQGRSQHRTEFRGHVFDEEQVMTTLEGKDKKMTLRDVSIFRLALACIFGDEEAMQDMVQRLESYPLYDLPIVRQHMRLFYHALATLILGRHKKNKEMANKGREIMKEFRKLDQIGSENARPAHLCLRAIERHKRHAYDQAIAACASNELVHMEAIMSEQCGRKQKAEGNEEAAREYLGRAYWLYKDWGADAKTKQLRIEFESLTDIPRPQLGKIQSSRSRLVVQSTEFVKSEEFEKGDGDLIDAPIPEAIRLPEELSLPESPRKKTTVRG